MENQEWGKERSFAPLVCVRERHKGEMLRADDIMSVSELEQAELVHSERRMAITSFACDIMCQLEGVQIHE
jgi:hypothetical protein